MRSLRVLIVDDHLAFAQALALGLAREPDMEILAAVHEPADAERIAAESAPDVALLDLQLRDGDGISLCRRLLAGHPDIKVVIMTAKESPEAVVEAVRAGACGWISKTSSLPDLVDMVRGARNGETRIPPRLLTEVLQRLTREQAARSVRDALLVTLTPREREVLTLMVHGVDRQAMAARLHLSNNTIRTHVQNLMVKLGAHSALEAMAIAVRHRLVETDAPQE